MSKTPDVIETELQCRLGTKPGGNLFTAWAVTSIEAATTSEALVFIEHHVILCETVLVQRRLAEQVARSPGTGL